MTLPRKIRAYRGGKADLTFWGRLIAESVRCPRWQVEVDRYAA